MRTSMKVILATMGVAVLAYPVKAGTWQNGYVQPDLSTDNVFWGMQSGQPVYGHHPAYEQPYGYPYGNGSAAHRTVGRPVAHPPAGPPAPGGIIEGVQPRIIDCVHVQFPQCSSGV